MDEQVLQQGLLDVTMMVTTLFRQCQPWLSARKAETEETVDEQVVQQGLLDVTMMMTLVHQWLPWKTDGKAGGWNAMFELLPRILLLSLFFSQHLLNNIENRWPCTSIDLLYG